MTALFIFNNIHFTLELLGFLAFLVAAWLALDAFALRPDRITGVRGAGFACLASWQLLHAFDFHSDLVLYGVYGIHILGLLLVITSFFLERPLPRPQFQAVIVLPTATTLFIPLSFVGAIGYALIAWFAFRQHIKEYKKAMKPLWIGCFFLAFGALSASIYKTEAFGVFWGLGHLFEIAGFVGIAWWGWQYLQLRLKEQMLLLFISATLFIATVVTLAFSTILINRVEAETKSNLVTNVKVLEFAIIRLEQEALAKAKFLAGRADIQQAVNEENLVELEKVLAQALERENLGFLTIVDRNGDVVLRAHALTRRDDNVSHELLIQEATGGTPVVDIEHNPFEQFAIRAASPMYAEGKVIGVVVAGFPLDNALVDNIKKITGLEMSIFATDTRVATTTLNPDGRTRSTGIVVSDAKVHETVLRRGELVTLRTEILSRPFLASYLPIISRDQKVVGMLSAAKAQYEIVDLATATNRLTFATVGVIMLVLIAPLYLITKKLVAAIQ